MNGAKQTYSNRSIKQTTTTRLLKKAGLGRPGLPPSGPVVRRTAPDGPPAQPQVSHFLEGEKKGRSSRGCDAVWASRTKRRSIEAKAWRGCRRCRRRGCRMRATDPGAPAAEEASPVGAHHHPPCPSAPASRSGRGSPFASEFALPSLSRLGRADSCAALSDSMPW